jgi:hypothetical protein
MTGTKRVQSWISCRIFIPGVPAPQLGLIEKHLDAFGAQRIAQVLRGFRVLGCMA